MHSYKIIIHFVDSTVVDVFVRNVEASGDEILRQFTESSWAISERGDMLVNTTNITHIELKEIGNG